MFNFVLSLPAILCGLLFLAVGCVLLFLLSVAFVVMFAIEWLAGAFQRWLDAQIARLFEGL